MKNFTRLFLASVLLIGFGCKKAEQQTVSQAGQVQFGMAKTIKTGSTTGKVLSATPEESPAFALLSITDAQGKAIETDKKIALYPFGGSFTSEKLSLKPGNYKLSKFLVLDASNKIIYASPLIGSAQAEYVTVPLPLSFSITENGSTLVTPQVVKVEADTPPESFGYVSFGFEVVETNSSLIKEYETFIYKSYPGSYIPEEKQVFHYTNGLLSKKETFNYLENYKVYYLSFYDEYEYNADNKLTKVTTFNNYNNSILWKYQLTYPSATTILWKWLTITSGYPDEVYYSYLYSRSGNNFSMDITEFPGQPSQSKYFFDGSFDQSNNINMKQQYDHGSGSPSNKLKLANYDNHPNPLKNVHEFFKTENSVYMSSNNLTQLRIENTVGTSYFQQDYSYEYNVEGYPVKSYLNNNSDGVITMKKMTYKY